MSLFASMRTSISGMAAQANKLGTVSDNIANSSTTGFKRVETEFASMLGETYVGNYQAGGVLTDVRHMIDQQGTLLSTTSATDLAVKGQGYFVVADSRGTYLTRAGSFVTDASGQLVNAAGFHLMGAPAGASPAANGLAGLQPVLMPQGSLVATPSRSATLTANFPAAATITPAASLPSNNSAGATYSDKTSLIAHDNLGAPVTLDVYLTKTAANTWEATAFDQSTATSGGFPYSSGPLATNVLSFNPATGAVASGGALTVAIPNGQALTIDLSRGTQLAGAFAINNVQIDGNAPSPFDKVQIASDGTIYAQYQDGTRAIAGSIPLASVSSPDNLAVLGGDVYGVSATSGDIRVGAADAAGLGAIKSSALEQSTVDIATELTSMIEAQHGYAANSKVFQTSSDLLDVLTNLKR